MNPGMSKDYLEVSDLTVSFDGFLAVDRVSLSVLSGELRFLIGPNGAGKTTVLDAVSGLVPATGSARYAGYELLGRKVHRINRLGVGRTFQTATVSRGCRCCRTWISRLARAAARGPCCGGAPVCRRKWQDPGDHRPDRAGRRPRWVLAHGQKQWLEIGMLLVQDARLLMLDEPVAGMSHEEKQETGRLLQRLATDRTVVVVEHDMDFMRSFATSVTVLHTGRVLAEGNVAEVQADPRVQEVYLGPGHSAEEVAVVFDVDAAEVEA